MPILYMSSNFKQKQHIKGKNCAKKAYKIPGKHFQTFPSNHIFGNGSFLAASCTCSHYSYRVEPKYTRFNWKCIFHRYGDFLKNSEAKHSYYVSYYEKKLTSYSKNQQMFIK